MKTSLRRWVNQVLATLLDSNSLLCANSQTLLAEGLECPQAILNGGAYWIQLAMHFGLWRYWATTCAFYFIFQFYKKVSYNLIKYKRTKGM